MAKRIFSCHFVMSMKSGVPREIWHMSCDLSLSSVRLSNLPPSPLLLSSLPIIIVLQLIPTKKDPRNEVGAIVHAVANRVLSDHTAKNIFVFAGHRRGFLRWTRAGGEECHLEADG